MGLFNDCEKYFGTKNLYEVLGISQDVSDSELKKAYKKSSLLHHPDRVADDKKEEATVKFQILSKIHCLLTDKEKRIAYNETGCIDEENLDLENKDWDYYWRILFPKITKSDIDAFMRKYKGSDEELEDLKKCYLQYEGDLNKISESFLGYDVNNEDMLRNILLDLIQKGEIPDYPQFTKETKSKRNARIKRYMKEAKEAEKFANRDLSVVDIITQRAKVREWQFNQMIASLEAKYCHNQSKKNVILYQKEADEAETEETDMDASLINAIKERSENRQSQFDSMIQNLEAKYEKSSSGKQKKVKNKNP